VLVEEECTGTVAVGDDAGTSFTDSEEASFGLSVVVGFAVVLIR